MRKRELSVPTITARRRGTRIAHGLRASPDCVHPRGRSRSDRQAMGSARAVGRAGSARTRHCDLSSVDRALHRPAASTTSFKASSTCAPSPARMVATTVTTTLSSVGRGPSLRSPAMVFGRSAGRRRPGRWRRRGGESVPPLTALSSPAVAPRGPARRVEFAPAAGVGALLDAGLPRM